MASSSAHRYECKEKATWNPVHRKIFIELMLEQTLSGNRPTTSFNKIGWKTIRDTFNQRTKKNYERMKFKNYHAQLKKEWSAWKKLISNTTGLGWDPVQQTITASDKQWEDYVKTNSKAAQFRSKPLENVTELDIIFGGASAQGELHYTKTDWAFMDDAHHVESSSPGMDDGDPETPLEGTVMPLDDDDKGGAVEGDAPLTIRQRSQSPSSRTGIRRECRTSEPGNCFNNYFDHTQARQKAQLEREAVLEKARLRRELAREKALLERESARLEREFAREKALLEREFAREKALLEREAAKEKDRLEREAAKEAARLPVQSCLSDALKCLKEMEDISIDSEMYLDVVELLEDPGAREAFILLDPTLRRKWLQRKLCRLHPSRDVAFL
ncbi:uncharacterized protein LOC143887840 [Tasmannia lanceolata]|uniref:uncharacterized protein LOC143887840 n=1 Tax=Tasmannia lanceolata TaxID=3420 RepID=UPI004064A04D